MQTDKKVQILLSTYNGEKYLREQLNSFINLENYNQVKVLIRDDGSTDGTCNILKEYHERHGFEVLKGENIGVNKSIMELLQKCDLKCDYFALSDQDDVWLKDKITKALTVLENEDHKIPLLFASCSQVVDCELNPISSTLIPKKGVSFYNAMVQNVTPGHTQVFNRRLLELLLQSKSAQNIQVIDWWIYLVGSGLGKVIFINDFTVKHRQHGNNAVGYQTNFLISFRNRLQRIRQNKANLISKQLQDFNLYFGSQVEDKYSNELSSYFSYQRYLHTRIKYIFKTRTYRQSLLESFIFKTLYLLGKYKV